jgi:hypothetical protein
MLRASSDAKAKNVKMEQKIKNLTSNVEEMIKR